MSTTALGGTTALVKVRPAERSFPRVFYYAPDHDVPSWGIGMLYTHVRLLRSSGIRAFVLHDIYPFRPSWLKMNVSRVYLDRRSFRSHPNDILVVPEVVADRGYLRADSEAPVPKIHCRRIVFVQGSSLIMAGLGQAQNYRELGYVGAITVMPHIQMILERHFSTPSALVPPCVAPYFFVDHARLGANSRKRQVVMHPKLRCEDYNIVAGILAWRLPKLGWRLVELKGKTHREVARAMQESAFHVSVNCQESFNATVPEAMAAGCIPICYEAFGGQDFLEDGKNAHVFPNHHVYPLIERTLDLACRYNGIQSDLMKMRLSAHATANRFTEKRTERALLNYIRPLLCP